LLDQGQVFIPIMHDLRRDHHPRQVGLEHIATIEPGRVALGGLVQSQPQRAPFCLDP
jgi:hypothetical protein